MKHLLVALVALCLMTACGTTKSASDGSKDKETARTEAAAMAYKKRVAANAQTQTCITAHAKINVQGAGKNLSVGGTLKMKRDDVVQLSLTVLGIEVGRLEFTPQDVLIVDRVNKQYVRARYDQVAFLQTADLDFYAFQSLLWNELFVPGQRFAAGQLHRFSVSESGDHTLLQLKDAKALDYNFVTATKTAQISRVTVESKDTRHKAGELVCRYDDFTRLGGKPFPQCIDLAFRGAGQDMGLTLQLSRLDNNAKWETRTTISSKYSKRDANALLQQLISQ